MMLNPSLYKKKNMIYKYTYTNKNTQITTSNKRGLKDVNFQLSTLRKCKILEAP